MQLFFFVIFIISLAGMLYFFWQKIPVLAELPLRQKIVKKNFLKDKNPLKNFSFEKILHRFLSFTRILILRAERKVCHWLQVLRKKNKKKEEDNYWQQLKK